MRASSAIIRLYQLHELKQLAAGGGSLESVCRDLSEDGTVSFSNYTCGAGKDIRFDVADAFDDWKEAHSDTWSSFDDFMDNYYRNGAYIKSLVDLENPDMQSELYVAYLNHVAEQNRKERQKQRAEERKVISFPSP